jgi:hypothetical protein
VQQQIYLYLYRYKRRSVPSRTNAESEWWVDSSVVAAAAELQRRTLREEASARLGDGRLSAGSALLPWTIGRCFSMVYSLKKEPSKVEEKRCIRRPLFN